MSFRLLFLCTGNTCRSPMAAGIAKSIVERRRLPVSVESAGVRAVPGKATPEAREAMARRSIDISDHRARSVGKVEGRPDLVLTMSHDHLDLLASSQPAWVPVSFGLRELVEVAESEAPRGRGETPSTYVARLAAGVRPQDWQEIEDPVGRGQTKYEACADHLQVLLGKVFDLLWP